MTIREGDSNRIGTDFKIISKPIYVETECPYCLIHIRIDYEEFKSYHKFIRDNIGDVVICPCCNREVVIKSID